MDEAVSNTRKWLLIVSVTVVVAVAIMCVAVATSTGDWKTVPLAFGMIVGIVALIFATLYLVFCLTIILHEFGHLAGVRLTGSKPLCVVLPHVNLFFRNGRYVSWQWRDATGLYMVQFSPRTTALLPHIVVVGAGPLANIAVGMLAMRVANLVQPQDASQWSASYSIASLAAWLNLGIGLSNLLPFKASGFASDGLQILTSVLTPRRMRERLAQTIAFYASMQVRPRESDPDLIAARLDPKRERGYWELLHYWQEMDRNEIAAAESWIRQAWTKIRDDSKGIRILREVGGYETAAYFTRFVHDPDLAQEAAKRVEREFPRSERREILEVARLWREGKQSEAKERLTKVVPRIKAVQGSDSLLEHVDDWFNRILDSTIPTIDPSIPAPETVI